MRIFLLPRDKTPKSYEDLVGPKLSQNWAGKLAIPPYSSWLVELSLFWGEKKVLDYPRKLLPLSAGQVRYNEKLLERVDYPKIFPWLTKEMEILPGETVLVYTSLQGILYNSNTARSKGA